MTRNEVFTWQHLNFDIDLIVADIDRDRLTGERVTIRRRSIEWYAETVLTGGAITQFKQIDIEYAKGLATSRSSEPVIFMSCPFAPAPSELGAGLEIRGVLRYEPSIKEILVPLAGTQGDVVAIDGNHRIASAYYGGRAAVEGLLLPLDDLCERYLLF